MYCNQKYCYWEWLESHAFGTLDTFILYIILEYFLILFYAKLFYKCNFKVFAANVVFPRLQLWMWLKNWWASTMTSLYGAMKGCLQIVATVEMNCVFVICESLRVNVFCEGWVRIVQTESVSVLVIFGAVISASALSYDWRNLEYFAWLLWWLFL